MLCWAPRGLVVARIVTLLQKKLSPTFANAAALDVMQDDDVQALMERFVHATMEERVRDGLCSCPPFLKRSYQLAKLRMQRLNESKRSKEAVQAALEANFVFEDEAAECADSVQWRSKLSGDMTEEEQTEATQAWRLAQASEDENIPAPGGNGEGACEHDGAVESRAAMTRCMKHELNWTV